MVRNSRFICIFLLIFITSHYYDTYSSTEIKSNMIILEEFLDSTLKELLSNNIFGARDSIIVDVISNDTLFSSVQLSFIREILYTNDGVIIYSDSKSGSKYSKKITFRWLNWEIKYSKIKKRFWQKKRFQRNLKADYFVEVFSYDNKLLFSKQFNMQFKDVLMKNEIDKVQSSNFKFTTGKIEDRKGLFEKYFEPVFLFAISGTVIYLFYSMRSQ